MTLTRFIRNSSRFEVKYRQELDALEQGIAVVEGLAQHPMSNIGFPSHWLMVNLALCQSRMNYS